MIVVIADDFTGAAEIAGAAYRYGLDTEVQTQFTPSSADVIVIDSASRSLDETGAADRVRQIAREVAKSRPAWIYKKVDSVLRGPVVAELDAIAQVLGSRRSLIVNANPRGGRCVIDGQLLIDGVPLHQTAFAHDPANPCDSSSVLQLLAPARTDVEIISPGVPQPTAAAGQTRSTIAVGNAADAAALMTYARTTSSETLVAGAAEFFEALLVHRKRVSESRRCSELRLSRRTLIACGSAVDWSQRRSQYARLEIPIVEAIHGSSSLAREIAERLAESRVVAAAVATTQHSSLNPTDGIQLLTAGVSAALEDTEVRQLMIEGGSTASAIIRACGWTRLRVTAIFADGVVGLQAADGNSPQLVVKPGSYPWPEACFVIAAKS